MSLKQVVSTVKGREVTATVLHFTPGINSNSKSPLLVFLPGNPGFINYYTVYLQAIHSRFPELEILGISHCGFSSLDGPVDEVFTLDDQIEHKVSLLEKYTGRPVFIMGHSVGCYVLQRCVERLPQLDWRFHGLLMPTIVEINQSAKGSKLSPVVSNLTSFAHGVGYLGYLTQYIPTRWMTSLLHTVLKDGNEDSIQCTNLLVTSPGFIRQALGLATEEMGTIRDLWGYQSQWFVQTSGDIWCVFTEGDHWIKDSTRDRLVQMFTETEGIDVDVLMTKEYTHSFCVSKSMEFARVTIEKLELLL